MWGQELFGVGAGGMNSQREAEVLDMGRRTDAGSVIAADSTSLMPTAQLWDLKEGVHRVGAAVTAPCSCCPPATAGSSST